MEGTLKSRGIYTRRAKTGESACSHHDNAHTSASSNNLHDMYVEAVNKVRLRQLSTAAYTGRYHTGREWWRSRTTCDTRAMLSSKLAAVMGLLGAVSAIWQNESVMRGGDPDSPEMELAKAFNMLMTALCLFFIFCHYWLHVLIFRINRHCRRLVDLDTRSAVPNVLRHPIFWIEILICGIHCPPRTTGEFVTYSFDNLIVYRAETLAAMINTLRLYLAWRVYRDSELAKIPKRYVIENFTGAAFGSIWVLKSNLNGWTGVTTLMLMWATVVLIFSYWFRAAEFTSCGLATTKAPECKTAPSTWGLFGSEFEPKNEVYMWDSLWLNIITTLTVSVPLKLGEGGFPFSHMQRARIQQICLIACVTFHV